MRILVSVDGSAAALRAVRHALRLVAGRADGAIILLNVQDRASLGVSEISAVITFAADRKLAAQQSRAQLRRAILLCRKAEAVFEARTELGPIAETIVHTAEEAGADQIVMGTRGLGRLGGLVLGSVGSKVVQLARVPVTLVK